MSCISKLNKINSNGHVLERLEIKGNEDGYLLFEKGKYLSYSFKIKHYNKEVNTPLSHGTTFKA